MSKLFVFTVAAIVLISAFTPVNIYAQEQEMAPVIKDSAGFQLAIVPSFQNPDTKEVNYKLVIYSQIRTDRLFVSWVVTGGAELVAADKTEGSVTLSVQENQTYTIPVTLKPRLQGLSNLFFTVEAFEAEGTYVATASQDVFSDRAGTIVPMASQVTIIQIALLIRGVAENILKLIGLIAVVLIGYRVFSSWLGPKAGKSALK
jgi:hypothetical protein